LKENGEWIKILGITEDLWKRIMQKTLEGVFRFLESTEILLDNEGNEVICAGLYTHALEEYGKFLALKQSDCVAGKVRIEYKDKFRDHTAKFRLAIENLPHECTIIGVIGFEQGFEQGFEREEIVSDLEARWGAFYTDFVDSGDDIKSAPPVDKKILKNALNKFRVIVLKEGIKI